MDHPPGADRATSPDGSICSKHLSGAGVCYRKKNVLRKSDTGSVGASRTGPGRKSQVPIGDRCAFSEQEVVGGRCAKLDRVENLKYLSGTGVSSRSKKLSGAGVPRMEKKKLSLERTTCLADKTNHPVERLSLNRSQCGSCSTKYDTSAGT